MRCLEPQRNDTRKHVWLRSRCRRRPFFAASAVSAFLQNVLRFDGNPASVDSNPAEQEGQQIEQATRMVVARSLQATACSSGLRWCRKQRSGSECKNGAVVAKGTVDYRDCRPLKAVQGIFPGQRVLTTVAPEAQLAHLTPHCLKSLQVEVAGWKPWAEAHLWAAAQT